MKHDISDEALVQYIRTKDQERYRDIMIRYEEKLLRYAEHLVRNSALAADIVQDSFIKAFKNLQGFDSKKKFSSWIYRIVHNEAINAVKRFHKEVKLVEADAIWNNEKIEDDYVRKELKDKVKHCLEQMSFMYREPITLYFLEEKSYEEISDILRMPMGTVATRINRGKQLMKKICQKNA
ncbi:MAG: RNA polymerase sigma factor [Candidatus Gottesmanbacteria bacterium]